MDIRPSPPVRMDFQKISGSVGIIGSSIFYMIAIITVCGRSQIKRVFDQDRMVEVGFVEWFRGIEVSTVPAT